MTTTEGEQETPTHLKRVSRIKHQILQKYLPAWEKILGSAHQKLAYIDCYAGRGTYEFEGQLVDGSPVIALKAANDYVGNKPGSELALIFVERDEKTRQELEKVLKREGSSKAVYTDILVEDARNFLEDLLAKVPRIVPTFFFVDPYGHPLTIPILNSILARRRTEALINFMYYRINMDASNPKALARVDTMFGGKEWRQQGFLKASGRKREEGFLQYFMDQIKAKYKLHFRIRFDPEDKVPPTRTKYYLIHASNHPKAALMMKEVMWPLGDQEGLFDYSGRSQGHLFSGSPSEGELRAFLLRNYLCKEISFDDLREETLQLPFIEKQYRSVIKGLKAKGRAEIRPVSSKTQRGLGSQDIVHILARRRRRQPNHRRSNSVGEE